MIKKIKKYLRMSQNIRNFVKETTGILAIMFYAIPVFSQDVTYIHDDIKYNQITVMESGFGSLDDFWHWSLHNQYSKEAAAKNKMVMRAATMEADMLQVEKADSIKSDFVKRGIIEGENLVDRNVDMVWLTERQRVESALLRFKTNYDAFCLYSPTTEEREYWKEKYDRLSWSVAAMRKGYMPNSERKKMFVELKEDIDKANKRLVACSYSLYVRRELARMNVARKPRNRTIEVIAKKAQNDWYSNLTKTGKKQ